MNHVVLETLCRCAQKRGLEQIRSCHDKIDAETEAYDWAESLNSSYCGKHSFEVVEVDDNYVIAVVEGGSADACELGVE